MEDTKGKVYGFVRFNNQNDQREALIHMNGFAGLNENKRPIKVNRSNKKFYAGCTKLCFIYRATQKNGQNLLLA